MSGPEPLLRVSRLTMAFGGLLALRDVDVEVRPGEIVGLIGPNGAGKTTFFNAVSGYLVPTRGDVYFAGRRVTGLGPFRLAQLGIGRTFQLVRPFSHLTVLENVMVGSFLRHPRRPDAEAAARRVLEWTGLADRADSPAGELTLAGRKRLEIARALATEPRLLLLDEVAAGLNPTEAEATVRLIEGLNARGITIVIVEHNMRVIMRISHRIVVLNHGQKIAEGSPQAVARDPAVVEAYLGQESAPAHATSPGGEPGRAV